NAYPKQTAPTGTAPTTVAPVVNPPDTRIATPSTTTPQPGADAPGLADLMTMYGGTGDRAGMTDNIIFKGDGTDQNAQGLLSLAQKYDPSAHIGQAGDLIFDRSKLPDQKFLSTLGQYSNNGTGNFWDKNRMLGADG